MPVSVIAPERSSRLAAVEVRPASLSDARRLWRWANDPDTRRWSLTPDPIRWDDHVVWLRQVLNDPDRRLLVGFDDYGEVGAVRFDVAVDECEVSITVAPECRGAGMARPLLSAALAHSPRESVVARVIVGNVASLRLFSGWDRIEERSDVVKLRLPK